MKKKSVEFLEKVRKVLYLLLLFNPLIIAGLCIVITPWLAWLSPMLALFSISEDLKLMSIFKGRASRALKEKIISIVIALHVLMTLFAIGFTIHSIWPNLYLSIWHGLMWLFSNYWIFIILVVLVFLNKLRKFNLKALERKSRGKYKSLDFKGFKLWFVYFQIRLTSNQLEKLEILLWNKVYSRRIFKKYFELATTEKALLNKERGEFKKTVFNDRLRINVVFSFLEEFAKKYKDEKNTRLAKSFMHNLASVVYARANYVMETNSEIRDEKNRLMLSEQINFAKNLLGSSLSYFTCTSNVEHLLNMAKIELKREQSREEKKKELITKEVAAGNVNKFLRNYCYCSEDLLKEFFDNLSLKKFEEDKIIEISSFKGVIWNNALDEFFEAVSDILKDTRNDELIGEIIKSIKALVEEVEQVGGDTLKKVIEKKQRQMLYSISTQKK
ncbi:MAG: hypothetical protein ACLFNO_01435 [Parcubacteria group bacterium]